MQPNDPTISSPSTAPAPGRSPSSPSTSAPAPDGTPVGPGPVGPAPTPTTPTELDNTEAVVDTSASSSADDVAKVQQGLRTGLGPQRQPGPDGVDRVTVADGESLEYILDREGVEADPAELYRANASAIEAAAQARGFGTSDNGRLLFPGTVLELPSR